MPRLLGWEYADLPADVRKTFDVALHTGSVPALLPALRRAGIGDPRMLALTLAPPAGAGFALEDAIQRRLGSAESVALAQIVAGAALLLADLRHEQRREPGALDHVAVGCGQAVALVPGVSRAGAALTAARLRGLSRSTSVRLSLRAALPVTLAAGALKGARLAKGSAGVARPLRGPLAAGAGAALLSALASLPLLSLVERRGPLRALACYRMALGAIVLSLTRRNRPPPAG